MPLVIRFECVSFRVTAAILHFNASDTCVFRVNVFIVYVCAVCCVWPVLARAFLQCMRACFWPRLAFTLSRQAGRQADSMHMRYSHTSYERKKSATQSIRLFVSGK